MTIKRSFFLAALIAAAVPVAGIRAQESRAAVTVRFTAEQLDNLVAPVALYPDAILAQVLVAATFPEQVEFAARYVRANGTKGIDEQSWDVSVKAIAHYPPVLNMLADRDDWATALGQAYAEQSGDVMESVQHLREMAREQGNLQSTAQQTVIVEDRNIRIVPAQPRVIYVPTYDPEVIYYSPVRIVGAYTGYWSFGIGFPIGAWLSYDVDWYGRRVYYNGWMGGGWRVAAYPFITINSWYVHPRYQVVYVNRDVWRRPVNYGGFGRYNTVHRTVVWNDRDRDRGRDNGRSPGPVGRGNQNGDRARDDNRGPDNRGRQSPPSPTPRVGTPRVGTTDPSRRAPSWTLPPSVPSRRDETRPGGNTGANDGRNNGASDRGARDRTPQAGPPVIIQRSSRPVIERQAPPTRSAQPPQARNAPPPSRSAPPSKSSSKGSSAGSSKGGGRRG